jgi:hypothetical protein
MLLGEYFGPKAKKKGLPRHTREALLYDERALLC